MIAIPMLVLEVPFAKWAHLAYRPVVLFLVKVIDRYERDQQGAVIQETAVQEAQVEEAA